ncbi:MAG: hypothetical protein ACTSRZ_13445 [Promethearchaeota archaeon]
MENDFEFKRVAENFNNASTFEEEMKVFPQLLDLFEIRGPSNFRLYFWRKASIEKKESFIRALFNYIILVPSSRKLELLKLVRNLFIDSETEIKKQFLMIVYAALFEKKNYKIALAALDFFTQMYSFFTESEKKEVFGHLIDFIKMSEPDIADEGINAIGNILQYLEKRQRLEFFNLLIKICKKRTEDQLKYVALENLDNLIEQYPSEFPVTERKIIFQKIKEIGEKVKKSKDPRVILSYLRNLVKFNILFDKKEEENLINYIKIVSKRLEGEYARDFLEILIKVRKTLKFYSVDEFLKPTLSYILELYKKRDLLNQVVKNKFDEFLELIWDSISDELKDKFYN